jgi:hypothetical protein
MKLNLSYFILWLFILLLTRIGLKYRFSKQYNYHTRFVSSNPVDSLKNNDFLITIRKVSGEDRIKVFGNCRFRLHFELHMITAIVKIVIVFRKVVNFGRY